MIIFIFTHETHGSWTITIPLSKGMTGGEAFDQAAAQYKAVFPGWVPGHPDVTVTIQGK